MIRGLYNAVADPRVRKEWRWHVFLKARDWLVPRQRLSWPYMTWWNDAWFNSFLEKFGMFEGLDADRRWALWQLTKLAVNVPGDTAECGVFRASSSYLICKSLDRCHLGFDSFEGQSEPSSQDNGYYSAGDMASPLEVARSNLAEFPKANLLKGWIPARFSEVGNRRFCFVHIDVQLYEPTRDSVAFFYPRMNPGGVIVCDDYGFTHSPGARQAIDEFLSSRPEKVIELPSGNAFMVRQ